MKKWIAILLAALMALTLVACGSKGEGIVGTWELSGSEDEESEQQVKMMLAMGMSMSVTFNADGTGSMKVAFNGEDESHDFAYTLEDGKLTMDGEEQTFKLDGDNLILDMNGVNMLFKRK